MKKTAASAAKTISGKKVPTAVKKAVAKKSPAAGKTASAKKKTAAEKKTTAAMEAASTSATKVKPAARRAPAAKPTARPAARPAASPAAKPAAKSSARDVPSGTLVIVESPAKAKTIEKYLGSKYTVLASMGHLIDLPKSRLGVNTENGFEPEYMTIRGKASLLKDLQKAAKKAKQVLLASDPDREGEAIAFQIGKYLQEKIPGLPCERIIFNEITPGAIKEAVKHPRSLDIPKVDAQKARRVLDRLVGYNLSPLLWKKVKNGLSAGRVQSVALRLICDREKEVESFIPVEYWSLDADFHKGKVGFSAELALYRGAKPEMNREADVLAIVKDIDGKPATVSEVKESERILKPKAPFTTSKLQQTAANRLGFTSKKTMQLAQQLYEGVNLGSTRIGLITYMRTDSTRISTQAIDEVRVYIAKEFPNALPAAPAIYASDAKAQDAHEAIRPTTVAYVPDEIKEYLTRDQLRLYTLIWERFVASQMSVARMSVTGADIAIGDAVFRCTTSRLVDKGFFAVLKVGIAREDKEAHSAPPLVAGEKLKVEGFRPEQHFTQGPSRFTDASIIKSMEELGIGRPSTYAPTISVLLERYYVTRETRQLVPTTLGKMISDILVES
ncbi:MAG: type I DNA topoisomerase, partial [Rectinemataceae bacterium]|nr:type I DNA topoisomerase [Rectinemataceae bacterium]